ncbi:WXG100 family type VII secretion target [Tumebacillus flagellatus]|uniref:WXG100 family type VII secretion target n=1 Tax=Tumebacillus flagellatus TaxID=1157490 RepID=UPI0013769218|nr:WXG100 family type VII secretion target [Tumebacillus flagellatus]
MQLKISTQRLYEERNHSLNSSQDLKQILETLGKSTVSASWTGSSYQTFRTAWTTFGGALNELASSYEMISSALSDAALAYEETESSITSAAK